METPGNYDLNLSSENSSIICPHLTCTFNIFFIQHLEQS